MVEVRVRERSGMARLGEIEIGKKKIKVPNMVAVVDPKKEVVETSYFKKVGVEVLMTSAFLLRELKEKNVKKLFKWDKVFFIDSGAYQMFSLGIRNIKEREIIKIEKESKGDVITALDSFVRLEEDFEVARKKVEETILACRRWAEFAEEVKRVAMYPVQGGLFKKLREKNCKEIKDLDGFFGVGGIVPLMMNYQFKELVDVIMVCKNRLASNKPLHCFGAGHPMVFSILCYMGVDTFDSAMYALAAREGRYLTSNGTLKLEEMEEFPCMCSICSKYTPKEVREMEAREREKVIAKHNLNVCVEEIRRIREAIRKQRLFELCLSRAKAHPRLYEGFIHLVKKYGKVIEKYEPVERKYGMFLFEKTCQKRPEMIRARKNVKRVGAKRFFKFPGIGKVPLGLRYAFPFSQTEFGFDFEIRKKPKAKEQIKQTLKYQFGENASKYFRKIEVKRSKTGRIRYVLVKGRLAGSIRASDGLFIPTLFGAELIKKALPFPKNRVVIAEEAKEWVKKGASVFCKFVVKVDKEIKPFQEVFVVDKDDNLIACGKTLLNAREIMEYKNHVAVKVRHSLGE